MWFCRTFKKWASGAVGEGLSGAGLANCQCATKFNWPKPVYHVPNWQLLLQGLIKFILPMRELATCNIN